MKSLISGLFQLLTSLSYLLAHLSRTDKKLVCSSLLSKLRNLFCHLCRYEWNSCCCSLFFIFDIFNNQNRSTRRYSFSIGIEYYMEARECAYFFFFLCKCNYFNIGQESFCTYLLENKQKKEIKIKCGLFFCCNFNDNIVYYVTRELKLEFKKTFFLLFLTL